MARQRGREGEVRKGFSPSIYRTSKFSKVLGHQGSCQREISSAYVEDPLALVVNPG